jgi:S1-C subfamily serine protease
MQRRSFVFLRPLAGLTITWIAFASPARADVQDAAKALLAATVTVEVESKPSEADNAASAYSASEYAASASASGALAVASGAVVAPNGMIVVAHVPDSEDADYYVRFAAGKRLPARVVVSDRRSGLRLLQAEEVTTPHLAPAEAPAEIGQRVLAAVVHQGGPVRYVRSKQPHVLSTGIIAATGRRADGVAVELLQTDLRAGAGSAGAPLCDEDGRLIGILVAADASQQESNVTLAIPARYVSELLRVPPGEKTVVIQPAYLGVQLEASEESEGAKVVQVFEDSPAAKAGIQAGDVVAALNGEEVQTPDDLTAHIAQLKSGAKVVLRLERGDENPEVEAVLAERPKPGPSPKQTNTEALELAIPGRYHVVPLQQGAGEAPVDPKYLETVTAWLRSAAQRDQHGARPTYSKSEVRDYTPLTVYVQRPQADERLDKLSEQVQALSEEVKKLSEQLQALSKKLDKPGNPMTREEAIQSLREEFLKKLDDLVRQQDAKPQ